MIYCNVSHSNISVIKISDYVQSYYLKPSNWINLSIILDMLIFYYIV